MSIEIGQQQETGFKMVCFQASSNSLFSANPQWPTNYVSVQKKNYYNKKNFEYIKKKNKNEKKKGGTFLTDAELFTFCFILLFIKIFFFQIKTTCYLYIRLYILKNGILYSWVGMACANKTTWRLFFFLVFFVAS